MLKQQYCEFMTTFERTIANNGNGDSVDFKMILFIGFIWLQQKLKPLLT